MLDEISTAVTPATLAACQGVPETPETRETLRFGRGTAVAIPRPHALANPASSVVCLLPCDLRCVPGPQRLRGTDPRADGIGLLVGLHFVGRVVERRVLGG